VNRLQTLDLKQLQVISNVSDPLILNTLPKTPRGPTKRRC
jgi:hypothetical protein